LIKVRLHGRLGNQLFQYAAARSLSLKNDSPLYFDFSSYGRKHYMLDYFNISGKPVGAIEKMKFFGRKNFIYEESDDYYDSRFLDLCGNVSVKGYFQSEKYFSDVKEEISEELSIRNLILSRNDLDFEKKIRESNSVAVHIRRSDYVGSAWDVCGEEYYYEAEAYIKDRVDIPVYFVFSDDINWCRQNIRLGETYYVESDASKLSTIKDLHLMSSCKHLIIPNSSFSWWGAWLCKNPNKIVVAPDRWSVNSEFSIADKICSFWHFVKAPAIANRYI